jgi:hypothetical protein
MSAESGEPKLPSLPPNCCGYTSDDGRCCSFPFNALHGEEYEKAVASAAEPQAARETDDD